MKKIFYFLLGTLMLFSFSTCEEDEQIKHDAGVIDMYRDGNSWPCKANTNVNKKEKDEFSLTIYNTYEGIPPPWGSIILWYIPSEVGEVDIRQFDPELDDPSVTYIHEVLNETTNIGYSDLWESYPDSHFEITHISKNKRKVEGNFKLAFIVEDHEITEYYGEPDTSYFEGSFEVKLKR